MIKTIANTIRGLAADTVEKANSGHPGMPLGTADLTAVLYSEVLKHDPSAPNWPDRDRFVLSAGHGSALLYTILHLTGYDLSLDELKRFRQLGSRTPGHPEYGITPGVETTTGPLGQGIANAVGMALAERMLAARFNRPGYEIVDHYTYVLAGDGCLMEGVSAEASSLAGSLGLGKLILLYDANDITIEGSTELAFTEDVAKRYLAYGWQVLQIDGHDFDEILKALEEAKAETSKPTIIVAKTIMAKCCPELEGSHKAHGAPLGKEKITAMKQNLNLPLADFQVAEEVYAFFAQKREDWQKVRQLWEDKFQAWSEKYPELKREWDRVMQRELPADLEEALPRFEVGSSGATRDIGGQVLNALAERLPELVGGSADLAPSTKTYLNNFPAIKADNFAGRNLHFGIREHAMGAIMNGLSLHGGFRVFGSTFLVFSDYMRPPIRLAALMNQPVIFVFTHDSFYVGEDGPTHEPIEHVEALRVIPRLQTVRPADPNETAWAWLEALKNTDSPTALILTRQKLPTLPGTNFDGFKRGGYIIKEAADRPDLVILASGSEVSLALNAAELLAAKGKNARVVSVPCREKFLKQDPDYIQNILGEGLPRVAIEAGIGNGWRQLVGAVGLVISMEDFGESGPADVLAKEFGFTPEKVVDKIEAFLQ
ncbi:MAG TPA: transketolase [Firmicutes bacterium]|nr:transketolase [Bacillota bacterium]